MAKKDNSQESPSTKKDEREERPTSKWRKQEWEHHARDVGETIPEDLKVSEYRSHFEKLNKSPEESNYGDKRGGAREGAGRPEGSKSKATKVMERLKDEAIYHGEAEIELTELNKKDNSVKIVKKKRVVAVLDMLAKEAVQKQNITAAKEYLDRTLGKATQPVEHSGEINEREQGIPDSPAIKAAQSAYHAALKENIKNQGNE